MAKGGHLGIARRRRAALALAGHRAQAAAEASVERERLAALEAALARAADALRRLLQSVGAPGVNSGADLPRWGPRAGPEGARGMLRGSGAALEPCLGFTTEPSVEQGMGERLQGAYGGLSAWQVTDRAAGNRQSGR